MTFVLTRSSCILTVVLWSKTRSMMVMLRGLSGTNTGGSMTSGNKIPAFGLLKKQPLMHLSKGDDICLNHALQGPSFFPLHPFGLSSHPSFHIH